MREFAGSHRRAVEARGGGFRCTPVDANASAPESARPSKPRRCAAQCRNPQSSGRTMRTQCRGWGCRTGRGPNVTGRSGSLGGRAGSEAAGRVQRVRAGRAAIAPRWSLSRGPRVGACQRDPLPVRLPGHDTPRCPPVGGQRREDRLIRRSGKRRCGAVADPSGRPRRGGHTVLTPDSRDGYGVPAAQLRGRG